MPREFKPGSFDGSKHPRQSGTFFDVIAAVVMGTGLVAMFLHITAGAAGAGALYAVVGIVTGLAIHASAVAMRWMAAMYELAARGFQPEYPAHQEGRQGSRHQSAA